MSFCLVDIYLFCYNESAIINQTIDYYKSRFKKCRIIVLDNHSTDDSVKIAKACGASIVTWGHRNFKDNQTLTHYKNNIWKKFSNAWIIICDMDEWLDINDKDLFMEYQSGTTIMRVKGYQMVSNSLCPNLSDIKLSNIRNGYLDNDYSKNIMFLSSAIININYNCGAHQCFPFGRINLSKKIYKLGHFKYLGLEYLINNYKINFNRTNMDRKKKMSLHYSNDETNIIKKYNEACLQSNIRPLLTTQAHQHQFIIFIPYCIYFKIFFVECLDSIKKQAYTLYTVVVVDDGNEDPTFIEQLREKYGFILLQHNTNLGAAASKWTFVNYLKNEVQSGTYTHNDVALIIDGDDYLKSKYAFNIINNTYNDKKCFGTFGEGECTEDFYSEHTRGLANYEDSTFNFKDKWCYNHPRSFKLFLLDILHKKHFQRDDENTWLTKATDRPIVYAMFEYFGKKKITHIPHNIYYYRIYENNSFNRVPRSQQQIQLKEVCARQYTQLTYSEKIHIVLCCWKRQQFLKTQLNNMNAQTIAHKIKFHLVNNNEENIDFINTLIEEQLKEEDNKLSFGISHHKNINNCFERFYYIREHLVPLGVQYVLIIDDDQIFAENWVEKMYAMRKPKTLITWYGRRWNTNMPLYYWKDSIVSNQDLIHNKKPSVKTFQYGGPGGCIIDTNIFSKYSILWNFSLTTHNVLKMDDLWLSYIIYKYNWSIQRSFMPQKYSFNTSSKESDKQSLWHGLIKEKHDFLQYLIKQKLFLQ